jgi:hypothetical protein
MSGFWAEFQAILPSNMLPFQVFKPLVKSALQSPRSPVLEFRICREKRREREVGLLLFQEISLRAMMTIPWPQGIGFRGGPQPSPRISRDIKGILSYLLCIEWGLELIIKHGLKTEDGLIWNMNVVIQLKMEIEEFMKI